MSITVSLGAAIFLVGAAVGALLTRLRIAFKQKISPEMMEQLGADPSVEAKQQKSAIRT